MRDDEDIFPGLPGLTRNSILVADAIMVGSCPVKGCYFISDGRTGNFMMSSGKPDLLFWLCDKHAYDAGKI